MEADKSEENPLLSHWGGAVSSVEVMTVSREGVRQKSLASMVAEVPFTLYLNGAQVVTLLCTGVDLPLLALGFLKSEGLIRDREALTRVEVDEKALTARIETTEETGFAHSLLGKRTVTSGCGKGSTFYNSLDALQRSPIEKPVVVSESQVRSLMAALNERSELYRETHGVHNCGLAQGGELILFKSDIGRHNALDMIVGACFMDSIPTADKALLTTGRITSEILIKSAKVGIPLIISRSSATSMAVALARELNVTLVGRVRAGSMILYTGWENVTPG